MNTAKKGAKAERRTMDVLETAGFNSVRSARSGGVFDVIAWNGVQSRFIQVKAGTSCVSAVEREALRNEKVPANATKEIWRWPTMGKNAQPLIEVLV